MLMMENVKLAFSGLKANKMRSFLTMLGIIIGIASVIAIMTIGNSLSSSISTSMQSMGANNITVSIKQKSSEEEVNEKGAKFGAQSKSSTLSEEDYLTEEIISKVSKQFKSQIDAVSLSETVGTGSINQQDVSANISLKGVNKGYFKANETFLIRGRNLTQKDIDGKKKVALISDKAVEYLFEGKNKDALGSTVEVVINDKRYQYTIVGVYEYEETSENYSTSSEDEITTDLFIPVSVAKEQQHMEGKYQNFTLVTKVGTDSSKLAENVENYINRNYYLTNENYEVSAYSMESMISSMTDMLSSVSLAIAVIAGISLLVGGIGVMNIMLVSITERTREIGTRKALGATNGSIRLQFIVESVVICLVGGILGIIIGIILGMAGAGLMGCEGSPSVMSIIISVMFSMTIGVFFGYYPANKAAKLNPIEALRYE